MRRPPVLAPEAFAGASVDLDGVNRDSFALARRLVAAGARVRIGGAVTAPAPLDEAEGILVEPGAPVGAADVLFVDSLRFPGPLVPYIAAALDRGALVSMLSDVAIAWSRAPALAVTGSAGKSSTTAMIGQILTAAGIPAPLPTITIVDNLFPNYETLEVLPELAPPGWLLAELTSSHLVYMRATPDVAVVTNLGPDHVEWHGSLEAYYGAKLRILSEEPGQVAVLNADDVTAEVFGPRAAGEIVWFSAEREVERGVFVRGGEVVARLDGRDETLGEAASVPVERPYLRNALAACAAALVAGAPTEVVARTLPVLERPRQRMVLLGEVDGIRAWNDGMAITPFKACASLEALGDRPLVWIAGGSLETFWTTGLHASPDEGRLLDRAATLATERAREIVLFGGAAPILAGRLADAGYPSASVRTVDTLTEAARTAAAVARPGDDILLSPVFYVGPESGDAFAPALLDALGFVRQ